MAWSRDEMAARAAAELRRIKTDRKLPTVLVVGEIVERLGVRRVVLGRERQVEEALLEPGVGDAGDRLYGTR